MLQQRSFFQLLFVVLQRRNFFLRQVFFELRCNNNGDLTSTTFGVTTTRIFDAITFGVTATEIFDAITFGVTTTGKINLRLLNIN